MHALMYAYFACDSLTGTRFWWAKVKSDTFVGLFVFSVMVCLVFDSAANVNLVAMFVWAAFRLSGVHCSVINNKTQHSVVENCDV